MKCREGNERTSYRLYITTQPCHCWTQEVLGFKTRLFTDNILTLLGSLIGSCGPKETSTFAQKVGYLILQRAELALEVTS